MGRPEDDDEFDEEFDDEEEWEDEGEEEADEFDEDDDEDDAEEESEKEAPAEEVAEKAPAAEAAPAPSGPTPMVSAQTIPFDLTVEVGRLKLTAKQLVSLGPGSVLELNIDPEGGLDLVAHGSCIGRGELIRVGDVLGVRVLSVG